MTLRNAWSTLREAGRAWVGDKATRLSAALAFYTLLSLAPLLLIAIAVAGAVYGRETAVGALIDQLRGLVGDAGATVAKTAVEHADQPRQGGLAAVIGIATLLYGASGVFGELQDALNTVWGVKPKPGRGIWVTLRDRFLSFGMVLVIGFLLLVSLVVSTALAAFGGYLGALVPNLPAFMQAVNFVFDFLVVTALFALIFKFLPDAKIAWQDVWFGAVVTTAFFTVGKYLIGFYLGRGGVTTPFGAAGSLVAFLVWTYYSGLILFFGAELTKVAAEHAGRKIRPSANAEPAKKEESGMKV